MKRGLPRIGVFACCWGLAAGAWLPAHGQAFGLNIDLENGGPESIGGGVPSDGFGGAANQPGRWNPVDAAGFGGFPLVDLSGLASSVTLSIDHHSGPGFAVGFAFAANTGDYARLLNDASVVGATGQGGAIAYSFSGFQAGSYDVYTYAVNTSGYLVSAPVTVPGAEDPQTQIVTGPMPGNSFAYLVTHSRHRVTLAQGGGFDVDLVQPPSLPAGHAFCVNGFQVVAVPEPSGCIIVASALALLVLKGNKPGARRKIP